MSDKTLPQHMQANCPRNLLRSSRGVLSLIFGLTLLSPIASIAVQSAHHDGEHFVAQSKMPTPTNIATALIKHPELSALRPPLTNLVVTSPFGGRLNPVMRTFLFHAGVDYRASSGTPVYAAQSGRVELAGLQNHLGLYVRLRHDADIETVYAHLHRIMPGLHAGSVVRVGDVIGFAGDSGFTTAPHLHFEVRVDGSPIDPQQLPKMLMVASGRS